MRRLGIPASLNARRPLAPVEKAAQMRDDRSMRRHAMGALVLAAACNAINGVGDLNEVACVDPCDGGADGAATVDGSVDGTSANDVVAPSADGRPPDAPPGSDGGVNYCAGMTLYVTFDGTL